MKKWLIGLSVLLVVFIASVYLLIPANVRITKKTSILVTQTALFRNMIQNQDWTNWWPGKAISISNPELQEYEYKNSRYSISTKTVNTIHFSIQHKNSIAKSILTFYPTKLDSTTLVWDAVVPTSYNPFKRIQLYFNATGISNNMESILGSIKSFFSVQRNIYGVEIKYSHVIDSFLVSTFEKSNNYPDISNAYKMIDKLKKYVGSKNAKETGYPMLNISNIDDGTWIMRVAIPVDRRLESSGDISYKWMLGGGNILIADVKGGPFTINKALEQLDNYVKDYQRIPPAIPFQSLVTDRIKESDTTKWITRIYYPIM